MKITPEIAEQINKLYREIGVKSQVAKIIGCSPSTVSRYIVEDYAENTMPIVGFSKSIGNCDSFKATIAELGGGAIGFCKACNLTEAEKLDLLELQKEICL
jgi:hypothetical protein